MAEALTPEQQTEFAMQVLQRGAELGYARMQVRVYTRGKDMAQAAERAAEKLDAARPQSNVTRLKR